MFQADQTQYNQPSQQKAQQYPATSGGLVMPQGKPQMTQQGPQQQGGQPQYMGAMPQMDRTMGPQPQGQYGGINPSANGVPKTYSVDQYQQWAQQRYGRQATPQELQQLAGKVGYKGGPINEEMWKKAQEESDVMARSLGWNGPSAPPWSSEPGKINPVEGRMFGPQYQNPFQQQQQDMMRQLLGSGGSMNQTMQDQLFERQKEQSNALAKQFGMMGQQAAGARGFSSGGNAAQAAQSQVNSNLARELMGGRRDISAQAAQVNRQDQLNALNASMGLDQQGYQQFMGDRSASLQEWLAQRGDHWQGQNYGLDNRRFLESIRQFNQSLGENSRQFNNQMGYNYANMNNNNQNDFMRYLMGY